MCVTRVLKKWHMATRMGMVVITIKSSSFADNKTASTWRP
jgi:hypothetical protein